MIMDISNFYAFIGFMLSAYAVIGNDSVQTLGTFISSNIRVFKWYVLWAAAALVMAMTISAGWFLHDGDISYGRLNKVPGIDIQWYHAAAPAMLMALTRFGIPVSTTFLILSVFTFGTDTLPAMFEKSILGYAVAAITAYILWLGVTRIINEKYDKVRRDRRVLWRSLQWLSTGFLWYTWLSHDIANIAVFAPRPMPFWMMVGTIVILAAWLAYIFWRGGGKIQNIVLQKSGTRFMRSATIIDFIYALILLFFKEVNDIPMSTTWVFVGLLCGRELAIATAYRARYAPTYVFPLVAKDFLKMTIGAGASITLVLAIHFFT